MELLADRSVAVGHDGGGGVLINFFTDAPAAAGRQRGGRVLIDFVGDEDAAVLAGELKGETVIHFVDSRVSIYGLHGCRGAIKCSEVDWRARSAAGAKFRHATTARGGAARGRRSS